MRENTAWLVLVLFIADLIAVALATVPPAFRLCGVRVLRVVLTEGCDHRRSRRSAARRLIHCDDPSQPAVLTAVFSRSNQVWVNGCRYV